MCIVEIFYCIPEKTLHHSLNEYYWCFFVLSHCDGHVTTMLWIFKKLMFLYPNEYISFGFHESIAGLPKISTENSIIRFGNPHFIFNCFFFWKSYPFFSQNYYLIHLNTIHFSWFVATSGDNVDKDLNLFWKMLLYVYIFFNIKIMLLNCVHLFQPKQ